MVTHSWQIRLNPSSWSIFFLLLALLTNILVVQGISFAINSYKCRGDFFSIQELDISCRSESGCGLGEEMELTGTREFPLLRYASRTISFQDCFVLLFQCFPHPNLFSYPFTPCQHHVEVLAENEIPTPLNLYSQAYIPGVMSAPILETLFNPCDYLVRKTLNDDNDDDDDDDEDGEKDGDTACPASGWYSFNVSYIIPDDMNTLWWSTGQNIYASLIFTNTDGGDDTSNTTTICDISLHPTNGTTTKGRYARFREDSIWYNTTFMFSYFVGASLLVMLVLLCCCGKLCCRGEGSDYYYDDDDDSSYSSERYYHHRHHFEMMEDPREPHVRI
jgi:hypothetical protein